MADDPGRADVDGPNVLQLFREPGRPEGLVTADVDAAQQHDVCHGCRRGIFSSVVAACHAKVAMTIADCFNSSSLMRSG